MIEFETETKKVEKHYTRISGIEVDTDLLIEFLEKIEDTNAMFPLTWERKYKHVAEALIEEGIVNSTNSGS